MAHGDGWRAAEPGYALDSAVAAGDDELGLAVAAGLPVGVLSVAADGRIVFANATAGELCRSDVADLVGESLSEILPSDGAPPEDAPLEAWNGAELHGRTADGEEFALAVSIRPHEFRDERLYTATVCSVTDRSRRERALTEEQAFTESVLDAVPDVVFAVDDRTRFLRWNDTLSELTGYTDEEIAERNPLDFLPPEERPTIADAVATVLEEGSTERREAHIVTREGRQIPHEFNSTLMTDDGEVLGIAGIARDVTRRKERERRLREQRDELQELSRINRAIRDVNQSLAGAMTREAVEQAAVERLVESDLYSSAWVGGFDVRPARVTPKASANVPESTLDTVVDVDRRDDCGPVPAGDAVRASEVVAVADVDDADYPAPWREAMLDGGYRAAVAVPLVHAGTTYGVLVVYGPREGAFTGRERTVLAELGETIGHAISAVQHRRLLHADAHAELEFRTSDRSVFFADASARTNCSFTLERIVPLPTGGTLQYVSAAGCDHERVADLAAATDGVAAHRVVDEYDDGCLFEFKLDRGSPLTAATSSGARVLSATAADGSVRFRLDVPPEAARDVADRIRERFEAVDLTEKQSVDRQLRSAADVRAELLDALTDRQRTALEAAYAAGYFERPRESTGDAVAASLGISRSTFHQHLRVGQRKLLDAVLDPDDDT